MILHIGKVTIGAALLLLVGCDGSGSTRRSPQPRVAVQSECAQIAIACYDGFARQRADLLCFRPTSRWPRTELTWRLVNPLPSADADAQIAAVAEAFALWAGASDLSFTQVDDDAEPDITIHYDPGDDNGAFPFDGPGGHLALAYFPGSPRPGEIYLSAIERWVLPPSSEDFSLFAVLVHEIGHALGLEHSPDPDAVMAPTYHGLIDRLTPDDIGAIQRLYGRADAGARPVPVRSIDRCGSPANLTALGDPDSDGDGIPDTIEVLVLGTDPLDEDTDGDGVTDHDEVFVFGSPPDAEGPDRDGDGLPDDTEAVAGTDPDDPDTDGDGLADGLEWFWYGTDPLAEDTDDDGFTDPNDPWPTFPALPADCNGNGIADSSESTADCNVNGAPDECDIEAGTSGDCNTNGVPDECEPDCNDNGAPDGCDIAAGTSADCAFNGVPDECEADCNTNGIADSCDIDYGTSPDCDTNGVPDECEAGASDCDSNGVPDACQIMETFFYDCNTNGLLDECELAAGTSPDCNTNAVPDECDLGRGASADCDGTGVPDECELAGRDCDADGLLDTCEILIGTGKDCNANTVLDACDLADRTSLDCTQNGVPDECDIAADPALDVNTNGVPDICEGL